MRRKIAMLAVLVGALAAGFGCRHIAGKNDCGYNPASYPIGAPTAPYQTYPVLGVVPPKEPVIPKSKDAGSDKEVKARAGMGINAGY